MSKKARTVTSKEFTYEPKNLIPPLKKYPKEAVSEVIFGSEMKEEVKDYIIKHTNFKYTEIVNEKESLRIIDCKF